MNSRENRFQLYDALYKNLVYVGDTSALSDAIDAAKAEDLTKYEEYSLTDYNNVVDAASAYLKQGLKTYAGIEEQIELLSEAKKALVLKTEDQPVFSGQKPVLEEVSGNGGSCSGSVGGSAAALGCVLVTGAAVTLKSKKKKED